MLHIPIPICVGSFINIWILNTAAQKCRRIPANAIPLSHLMYTQPFSHEAFTWQSIFYRTAEPKNAVTIGIF